jgi:hypothetical protein
VEHHYPSLFPAAQGTGNRSNLAGDQRIRVVDRCRDLQLVEGQRFRGEDIIDITHVTELGRGGEGRE